MTPPTPSPALDRMEAALAAAARRFLTESRRALIDRTQRHEIRAICARLGLPPHACTALASGTANPALKADAMARLSREARRLARASRGSRIGYDLNRHIAIRRAIAQLAGDAAQTLPARPSGRELNTRFCRRGPRNRAPKQITASSGQR